MDPGQDSQIPAAKTLIQRTKLSQTSYFVTPDNHLVCGTSLTSEREVRILPRLTMVYSVPKHNQPSPTFSSQPTTSSCWSLSDDQ